MTTLEQIKTLINGILQKIPKLVNPDWNENDPTKPSHILNRPFYTDKASIKQIDRQYIPNEFENTVEYFDLSKYVLESDGVLYKNRGLDPSWVDDLSELILDKHKAVVIYGKCGPNPGDWGTGTIDELHMVSGNRIEGIHCTIGTHQLDLRRTIVSNVTYNQSRLPNGSNYKGRFVQVDYQGNIQLAPLVSSGKNGQFVRIGYVNPAVGIPSNFEAADIQCEQKHKYVAAKTISADGISTWSNTFSLDCLIVYIYSPVVDGTSEQAVSWQVSVYKGTTQTLNAVVADMGVSEGSGRWGVVTAKNENGVPIGCYSKVGVSSQVEGGQMLTSVGYADEGAPYTQVQVSSVDGKPFPIGSTIKVYGFALQ